MNKHAKQLFKWGSAAENPETVHFSSVTPQIVTVAGYFWWV